MLVSTCSVLE